MKNILIRVGCTFSLLILLVNLSVGQETEFLIHREIKLFGDSKTEEIKIENKEGTSILRISVQSKLTAGDITIEINDPVGESQGNFSISSVVNSKSSIEKNDKSNKHKVEEANGLLKKQIKDPIEGTWVIKIIPKKAEGKVIIDTQQIKNFD